MLESIIENLRAAAPLIIVVFAGLIFNKLWPRRHARSLAESISIITVIIGLSACLFFIPYHWTHGNYPYLSIYICLAILLLFLGRIAIGSWVKQARQRWLGAALFHATCSETVELISAIRGMVKPAGAEVILELLRQVAWLDDDLAPEEEEMLKRFTKRWHLDPVDLSPSSEDRKGIQRYLRVRQTVQQYLNLEPPSRQAEAVGNFIHQLVHLDGKVTDQEAMALTEIQGLIEQYSLEKLHHDAYHVVLEPSSEDEENMVRVTLPHSRPIMRRGHRVYVAETFHSELLAQEVAKHYEELKIPTRIEQEREMHR